VALYETVLIARQDISVAQVEALTEQFTGVLTAQGGAVRKTEYWGLKSLAYRIKKNRKGHYVLFNIDSAAPAVLEMERTMRLNEDVLRFQTVRVDELEEGLSAMMQNKGERDGRRRRDEGDGDGMGRGDHHRGMEQ
jgi:small subunit ribosomal protein S6